MLKHLYFFAGAYNTLLLYMYLADDVLPTKFTLGFWGVFTVTIMFVEALKLYFVEKTQAILKHEIDQIVENNSLTDDQKKDRVIKLLKSFIEDKARKKENTDE